MRTFGEKLKSARAMSALSLQGLADKIGNRVTKQALSKYETGKVLPDGEMITVLSEAMGVRPDYFYSDTHIELGKVEFRKLQKYPAKERERIMELAKDALGRYIELEQLLGLEPRLPNHPLKDLPIRSNQDVEKAAGKLRDKWGLGATAPLSSVIELLEDNHIKVIELESHVGLDGFSTYAIAEDGKAHVPVIALNKSKLDGKADRKRWTALHELGHLLLDIDGSASEREKESFCHYFAGAMLLPERSIRNELGESRHRLSFTELGAIKMQYGISMQAVIYRAKDLGIISESYMAQIFKMFNQLGYRVHEPAQYDYNGAETCMRFKQLLFRGIVEERVSMSKAAALSNMKLAQFRKENQVI